MSHIYVSIGSGVHNAPLGISESEWNNRCHKWFRDIYYDMRGDGLIKRMKLPSGLFHYEICQNLEEISFDEINYPKDEHGNPLTGNDTWRENYFFNCNGVIILCLWNQNTYRRVIENASSKRSRCQDDSLQGTIRPPPISFVPDVHRPSSVPPPPTSSVPPPPTSSVPPLPTSSVPPLPTSSVPPVPLSPNPIYVQSGGALEIVSFTRFVSVQKKNKITIMERENDPKNPGKFIYSVNECLPVLKYSPGHIKSLEGQNHADSWFEDHFYDSQGQMILARFCDGSGIYHYMHVKNE
jgi:hypothetical protein